LPLRGTRIVTLAVNVPGPAAAARLRELGAQITKVEPPHGDPLEHLCPDWYRELAKNQKVVRLDLRTPKDRASLDRLLENADVLITSSRPSSLRRLSIEWKRLHKKFPRLCYVALVGEPAPKDELPGHDLTYQAVAGLLLPPRLPNSLVADLAGAERAVSAVLALLSLRTQTHAACRMEVAIADAAARFAAPLRHGLTSEGALLGGGFPGYSLYRSKQGWIAVAALESHFWTKLRQELRLNAATRQDLAARFRTRSSQQWQTWAKKRGLPIVAVRQL